jgi:hypothetical protein
LFSETAYNAIAVQSLFQALFHAVTFFLLVHLHAASSVRVDTLVPARVTQGLIVLLVYIESAKCALAGTKWSAMSLVKQ